MTDSFRDITWKFPRPDWEMKASGEIVKFSPYFSGQTFWEVEDRILKTVVVDLLRAEGYTVIEPGGKDD